MNVKEIKRLLDAVAAADIAEFTLETGEVKLTVKRGAEPAVVHVPGAAAAPAAPPALPETRPAPAAPQESAAPAEPPSRLVEVTAPIVGTFYEAPSPGAGPFVKVGDRVKAGAVLCIIEAMKLMNEIEAETSGRVAEVLVRNEEPVEYGQVLFRIDPD